MKDPSTQLKRAYKKRLKSLNKKFFNNKNIGLELFLEHLKYTRDFLILQNSECAPVLITAIAEFEMYQASTDEKQKAFHWRNFCEFIKLNYGGIASTK
jgi:hypothetical protein